MYEQIFELRTHPFEETEKWSAEDFIYLDCASSFIGPIADHVTDTTDPAIERTYLKQTLQEKIAPFVQFKEEDKGFRFVHGFKEVYFADARQEFLTMLGLLKDGLVSFSDEYFAWGVTNAIDYPFGTYVLLDNRLFSLDAFIRHAKPDVTYYIGTILCYHR